jgi:4-diphosphocytidyl-2-C-methyl-D-erythritol kinase
MKAEFMVKAPAKINLGLTVLGPRTDGYHEIESVMQSVSLADTLLFEPAPGSGWSFSCSDPGLSGKDNLVCRAAELLSSRAEKKLSGVKITLYKNIPVEAGLAGGSSDAAAALIGLNRYWQLDLKRSELIRAGSLLGSDVPFCLQGGTALARGRGEIVEPLPPLPFFWVAVAIPAGVKFSTAEVYGSYNRSLNGKPVLSSLVKAIRRENRTEILEWLASGLTNTLESAELAGTKNLVRLKGKLQEYGFKPALSGSGPALFILTEDYSLARSAMRVIEDQNGRAYLCWTVPGNKELKRNV